MLPPKTLPGSHGLLANSGPDILPSPAVVRTVLTCGSRRPADCVIVGLLLETKS